MPKKSNNRRDGRLKSLSRFTIPKHVLFYDTETFVNDDDKSYVTFPFRLGVAIYCKLDGEGNVKLREVYKFKDKQEFLDLCIDLAGNRYKLYVFAHNQGFDLRVLDAFDYYDEQGFEAKPPIINNLVFIYGIKKGKKKIDFIDTSNIGVRSVEQLGLDMGFPKMDVDFKNVSDEDLFTYCQRDVEVLEKFVLNYIQFIVVNNLGSFKVTLASQALAAFRTSFMYDPIHIHTLTGALNLERDAYYGGRTECNFIGYAGQENWYYVDVNSMYPYVMTEYDVPAKLIGYKKKTNSKDLSKLIKDYYVIADVTLNTNEAVYPLRLTNKTDKYNHLKNPHDLDYPEAYMRRLIFPTGIYRTTLHHIELEHALDRGHIRQVHRIAYYTKHKPFDKYINYFFKQKNIHGASGNKTWRMISKLFLNSLYGKFGQLQPHRKHLGSNVLNRYGRHHDYYKPEEMYTQILYWQNEEYREYKLGETSFSNPAIAGAITAYARYTLYLFMEFAGKENTYYMDTDSLIVNQEGYDNLKDYMDKERIGMLDLEATSRRLIIRGNKDYMIDGKRKHKGIKKSAKKTGKNEWEFLHFQGFLSWWNNGAIDQMIGEYRTKSRKTKYNKGIISESGRVIPYHLRED